MVTVRHIIIWHPFFPCPRPCWFFNLYGCVEEWHGRNSRRLSTGYPKRVQCGFISVMLSQLVLPWCFVRFVGFSISDSVRRVLCSAFQPRTDVGIEGMAVNGASPVWTIWYVAHIGPRQGGLRWFCCHQDLWSRGTFVSEDLLERESSCQ